MSVYPSQYQSSPAFPSPYGESKSSDTSVVKASGIQIGHDADVLIESYLPPRTGTSARNVPPAELPPLCIPQISPSGRWDSAFARGYNPVLMDISIPQDMLLSFIDGLNLAIAASPPLRVVDAAGMIIGLVPYHWAMIAGTVMQTTAQIGMHVLSKTLTDRYLRAANQTLFKPRGLSVRLCTTPAMFTLLGHTGAHDPSKLDKFGRGVGKVLLKLPLPIIGPTVRRIVHAVADAPPTIAPTGRAGDPIKTPVLMRRLALVQDIALPLDLDAMPPPVKPQGVMDTMASWGVKFDGYLASRSERNIEEKRRALQRIKEAKLVYDPYTRRAVPTALPSSSYSLSPPERPRSASSSNSNLESLQNLGSDILQARRDRKWQKEVRREVRQQGKRMRRGDIGLYRPPKPTRMEKAVKNADLIEHWNSESVLWIVVMPADRDSAIENIELADDPANEEHVPDDIWHAEMERERDDLEEYEREEKAHAEEAAHYGS